MKQKMSVLSMVVLMLMVSATAVMVVTQAFNQDFNRALGMMSPSSSAKAPQSNSHTANVPTNLAPTTSSTGTTVPSNTNPTNNANSSLLVNPSTSSNHTRGEWDD